MWRANTPTSGTKLFQVSFFFDRQKKFFCSLKRLKDRVTGATEANKIHRSGRRPKNTPITSDNLSLPSYCFLFVGFGPFDMFIWYAVIQDFVALNTWWRREPFVLNDDIFLITHNHGPFCGVKPCTCVCYHLSQFVFLFVMMPSSSHWHLCFVHTPLFCYTVVQ